QSSLVHPDGPTGRRSGEPLLDPAGSLAVRNRSFANTLRSCRRELLGAGAPSDRLRPAYALVKKACAQQDKGARCFDTAATFHPLGEGTPAARAQDRAIDCGFDEATKGLSLLADAEEEGSEIEAEAGWGGGWRG